MYLCEVTLGKESKASNEIITKWDLKKKENLLQQKQLGLLFIRNNDKD